ncbi:MAG: L,D-transpeptidase [Solirubrobacteraceae bacterium]|nr:L,D-transpeptidase [Solirubrobacteraceae bacterium]
MSWASRVALSAALVCLVAPASALASPAVGDPSAPSARLASTATLISDAPVYAKPGGGKAVATARADTSWTGSQAVLLVAASRRDASGRLWLKLMLPVRPNGSSGWILADHARISTTSSRVEISLRARKLRLRAAGKIIFTTRVVIGKAATPTPRGNFAIYERAQSPRGSNVGPFALHLTAFSDVLHSYDGGPGRIAIHGRAGSLLADPLGSARSHGCIRIRNSTLKRLAKYARAGTPVTIASGWPNPPAQLPSEASRPG